MRYSTKRLAVWTAGLGLVLALAGVSAWAAPAVVINGMPLVTQNPPVTMGGSILLPMRDVFTALQAEIKWFAAERKILAIRGDTTIQLVLGSRLAMINNMPMQLPVPATLVGAITYVPLRFPAEAFGGTVRWDGPTQTAFIDIPTGGETAGGGGQQVVQPTEPTQPTQPTQPAQPTQPTQPTEPTQPAAPEPVAIEGTLVQVFATANPSLVVQVGADNMRMIQLSATTVLTRAAVGTEPATVQLNALQVGDLIQGQVTDQGVALTLNATYGEKAGKVAALAGNTLLFEDGETLVLGANVQVVGPNNKAAALANVIPGTQLTARFQPMTKVIWRLELAAAPKPPVVQPTKVEIFTVGLLNPGTTFKAGDRLTIQLQGTPGSTATVSLPGVAPDDVPLPEIAAGIYQANYTVPAQASAQDVVLTGHLTKNALQATPKNAPVTLDFDSAKPTFQSLTPKANTTINNTAPTIEVAYTDAGGVDINAAVMRLDGRDVSAQATVTPERLTYAAQNLAAGVHQAFVQIQDLAGNRDSRSWSFTVAAPVLAQPILAVWHDATAALAPGQTLTVYAQVAQPGGVATFSIGGGWRANRAMTRQGTTPIYRGSYVVQAGDTINDGVVRVAYTPAGGTLGTMEATNPVNINPVAPVALDVASPLTGSQVEDQIQVAGHALPGSKVRVTISYKTKLVTTITGQLWQGTVTAGADGSWETPAVSSDVFLGKANEYTILVEALNASNAVTASKTIKLVK